MSIKMKLVSLVSAFILVLGLVITGVLAASSQTITMNGSVNFNVTDRSLWVKEVRMQEAGEDPVIISNFTPGYINGDFNFNVGDHNNSRGSFALQFDIINTTTNTYLVNVDYSGLSIITGLEVNITNLIPANTETITTITSETPITTTLELIVSNPNLADIDLSLITININEVALGTLTYSYDSEALTATVTGCSEGAEIVIIPETVQYNNQTYEVNAVTDGTSSSGPFYSSQSTLTSVNIPKTINSIGDYAFYHCSNLALVTIDEASQLSSIGQHAFSLCSSLTSITMPDGVTSIDVGVFSNCSSLTSITIPSSVTSIGDSAFSNCTALTEINYNAKNVSDLSSNNHVFSYAGQDGTGITVNIGSNVTKIPSYIFCPDSNSFEQGFLPNITTVNFEEGSVCESIGEHAFQYCRRLTSITIPERVTEISSDAFYGCSSLNEVTAESDDIYLALTSQSACGYLIYYVYATGETVRVLKSVVDSVDPDFTVKTYLNGSNFERSEEGDYYVYTHI